MALAVTGATIWLLISLAVIFSVVKAPRRLIQAGLAILCFESVFLVIASSTAQCAGGPCFGEEQITEASGLPATVVTYVIPVLTVAFTLGAIAYGVLRRERVLRRRG